MLDLKRAAHRVGNVGGTIDRVPVEALEQLVVEADEHAPDLGRTHQRALRACS
jgi:hypothetical protein